MEKKNVVQLSEQFIATYESEVRKYEREGFSKEDAQNLAARSMMYRWANQYVEGDRFHDHQVAMRDKRIADLKAQNERQIGMIEALGG